MLFTFNSLVRYAVSYVVVYFHTISIPCFTQHIHCRKHARALVLSLVVFFRCCHRYTHTTSYMCSVGFFECSVSHLSQSLRWLNALNDISSCWSAELPKYKSWFECGWLHSRCIAPKIYQKGNYRKQPIKRASISEKWLGFRVVFPNPEEKRIHFFFSSLLVSWMLSSHNECVWIVLEGQKKCYHLNIKRTVYV